MKGRVAKAVRRALLVGVVALVLLGAAGFWLAQSEAGHRWTMARIAAALGPSVRFADAHFTFWPPPLAVALDGVEYLGSDGTAVVRAEQVIARVRLRALVGKPPLVGQIIVEGFAAELSRAPDGALRLGRHPLGGGGGASALPATFDASCPRVDLSDGRVILRDERPDGVRVLQVDAIDAQVLPTRPGARVSLNGRSAILGELRAEWTLSKLGDFPNAPFVAELEARDADVGALTAWLPPAAAGFTMSGHARFTASARGIPAAGQAEIAVDLHSGDVAWRDQVQAAAPIAAKIDGGWNAQGLSTAGGGFDAAQVGIAGVNVSAVHADFTATPDALTLHDGRWQAFGSQWTQGGTIRVAHDVALDNVVFDADAVDGAELVAALQPRFGDTLAPLKVDGSLRLHAAASGTVGAPIDGQVAVSMAAGSATWDKRSVSAPLSISADATLEGSAISVRNGHAQAATASDKDLSADALDLCFAYANQTLTIDTFTARAFDGDWTLSGTVPLSGAPTLSLSAVGINAAHLARAFLTGRHEEAGTAGDVDVTATLRGGSGRINLRLASPTLSIGPLLISQPASASGTLGWNGDAVRVSNGTAQLNRVRFAQTDIGNVRAAFASAGPGHLRVSPLTARAFGGLWTINTTLARDEIDGDLRAVAVNLDGLLAALGGGPRSVGASATIDATVRRPRSGMTTADLGVQLPRGRFLFNDLTVVAPASGTGRLTLDGERWGVENAIVSAAAASFAMIKTTRANAHLDFDADQIRFADLRAVAANAPWQGNGRIDLNRPSIDGTVAVTRADPDTLLALVKINAPGLDPDGLDLKLHASTPLDATWRQTLQGSGTMALRGGYLTSTGLLRAIVAAIVPSRSLREGGPPNRLHSLTQSFTLGDGRLRTQDMVIDSNDYNATASGTIGFEGQLDLTAQVTLTPNGIKKVFALSALPIPGSSLFSLPTIPARVDGTLEKPGFHPEATAFAGSTARWFVDALIGAPRAIGTTVTRPLVDAFDGMRNFFDRRTPTPAPTP